MAGEEALLTPSRRLEHKFSKQIQCAPRQPQPQSWSRGNLLILLWKRRLLLLRLLSHNIGNSLEGNFPTRTHSSFEYIAHTYPLWWKSFFIWRGRREAAAAVAHCSPLSPRRRGSDNDTQATGPVDVVVGLLGARPSTSPHHRFQATDEMISNIVERWEISLALRQTDGMPATRLSFKLRNYRPSIHWASLCYCRFALGSRSCLWIIYGNICQLFPRPELKTQGQIQCAEWLLLFLLHAGAGK